ncbi:hypothetical protein CerSpe_252480 [Prunus speciosa]
MEPIKVKHVVSFLLFLCLAKICTSSPVGKKHFVLVHGAWNWYKMTNLLTSIGHNVTALDLAAAGVNPNQVQLYSLWSLFHQGRQLSWWAIAWVGPPYPPPWRGFLRKSPPRYLPML